jgi:hypothetical protein
VGDSEGRLDTIVLLLGGGGWYAQISAIALAPSRMPRIYSAVASFARPQPSCSKFFLRWSRASKGCLEVRIVMDHFFFFWPAPLARISTELDKTPLASNKMLQPRKRL